MSISEWAEKLDIDSHVIRQRLKYGWSVEKTLETPLDKSHSRRKKKS